MAVCRAVIGSIPNIAKRLAHLYFLDDMGHKPGQNPEHSNSNDLVSRQAHVTSEAGQAAVDVNRKRLARDLLRGFAYRGENLGRVPC